MKRATPSELRRMAIISECNPAPEGVAAVLLACAAVGSAIDAHGPQGQDWPSFGKCKANVYDYGEGVYTALIAGSSQADLVKEGWGLVREWIGMVAPAVTEEALHEALDPTEAGSPARGTSEDGASGPSSSVT